MMYAEIERDIGKNTQLQKKLTSQGHFSNFIWVYYYALVNFHTANFKTLLVFWVLLLIFVLSGVKPQFPVLLHLTDSMALRTELI